MLRCVFVHTHLLAKVDSRSGTCMYYTTVVNDTVQVVALHAGSCAKDGVLLC
jgi:hypothetical protein